MYKAIKKNKMDLKYEEINWEEEDKDEGGR